MCNISFMAVGLGFKQSLGHKFKDQTVLSSQLRGTADGSGVRCFRGISCRSISQYWHCLFLFVGIQQSSLQLLEKTARSHCHGSGLCWNAQCAESSILRSSFNIRWTSWPKVGCLQQISQTLAIETHGWWMWVSPSMWPMGCLLISLPLHHFFELPATIASI